MQSSHYIVIRGRIRVCCSTWIQCFYPCYQQNLFNTFTANLITPQVKDFCTSAGPIKLQAVTNEYSKCHFLIEMSFKHRKIIWGLSKLKIVNCPSLDICHFHFKCNIMDYKTKIWFCDRKQKISTKSKSSWCGRMIGPACRIWDRSMAVNMLCGNILANNNPKCDLRELFSTRYFSAIHSSPAVH